ncbi:MAG: hypothetical protein NWF07_01565 [Candidatus Bathyarchaeota archaeon]|nr:hypothetical protein [Candidatus Bathyarchaeota archaeon]
MSRLLVVKYGGSVLNDGAGIREAAVQVKTELDNGNRVVVVVSALKGATDKLIEAATAIHPNVPRSVQDHIIRLGEEQSTRLFASALELIGIRAEEFTVDSPGWPIITDDNFGDAEPIMDECRKAVAYGLKPLLNRGVTPVVSGFVGRSINGMVTTLGRGGTDTTATVLARCLDANELVLVKDVGGVYSADPHLVEGSEKLREISTRDAYLLSSNGAKVLHDKVFRHKNPELDIRLISRGEALTETGTLVKGDLPRVEISVDDERIHEVSLVGDGAEKSQVVQEAVDRLTCIGGIVHSIEASEGRLVICFTHDALIALKTLHEVVAHHGLKSISLKENLRRVTVSGKDVKLIRSKIPDILEITGVYCLKTDQTGVSITVEEASLDQVLGSF